MPWPVHPTGFFGARGDSDTYKIERSLRFNSADTAYLNRTFSSGNRKTWTWSGWIKRTKLGTTQRFFTVRSGNDDTTTGEIYFNNSDQIGVIGWNTAWRITSNVLRDISSWYHFVVVLDTTQSTANNRVRIYINGSEATSFATINNPSLNADLAINQNLIHYLGTASYGDYSDFYLAEVNFIDGQALTPSSFGETDAITGRWKAKAYGGTYGTNGFYLSFKDNTSTTTLGYDDAGSNDWTLNNFSVTAGAGNDSLVDSPTNYGTDSYSTSIDNARGNYATLNQLWKGSSQTVVNGNLDVSSSGVVSNQAFSTIVGMSGLWYFEVNITTNSNGNAVIGVATPNSSPNTYAGQDSNSWGFEPWTNSYRTHINGSPTTVSASGLVGTGVFGIAFDSSTGKLWATNQSGTWLNSGNPQSGTGAIITGITVTNGLLASIGQFSSGSQSTAISVNFGQRPFAYTAPSGFKALCTQNLPQPTIQKPSTAMDVVTYTGTGASQSISSLGFPPDLVWIKGRSGATDHALYDTTRGATFDLVANSTAAQTTQAQGLTAFGSNGFTVGTLAKLNTNTSTYVAWAWDKTALDGFDIVSYTGNSSTQNISHGLGVAPSMIIVKTYSPSVDAGEGNWCVYHKSLGANKFVYLDLTNAAVTSTTIWNNTSPTASVFSLGNDNNVNKTGKTQIAYCFAEIEGFSKFGSYTGNGSSDGPFVWCGFRPRWVMQKRTDSSDNWNIFDTSRSSFNVTKANLEADTSDAELTANDFMDILSNGFKLKANLTSSNASGGTYIFAAFAESPFKYARAR